MATESELFERIESCRICSIFYLTTSNILRPIFLAPVDDPDMCQIRMELANWKLEISENDGLPQFICNTCVHEFKCIFKFRRSCIAIQEQLREYYHTRQLNHVQIKTENPDPNDMSSSHFIYVDDLSDNEYDGSTPFHIPHAPIKEEVIEEAMVPKENVSNNNEKDKSRIETVPNMWNKTEQQSFDGNIDTLKINNQTIDKIDEPVQTLQIKSEPVETFVQARDIKVESIATSQKKSLECNTCSHVSTNEYQHKQHMQNIHEIKNFECHLCGKKLINCTIKRYKYHLKWHKLSKHIKCIQCGFVCNSKAMLREHTRAVHTKVQCKLCGKFVFPKKLDSHIKEQHGCEWQCDKCKNFFATEDERDHHVWMVHTEDYSSDDVNVINIFSNECNYCNQNFPNAEELTTHIIKMHTLPIQDTSEEIDNKSEMNASIDAYTDESVADFALSEESSNLYDSTSKTTFYDSLNENPLDDSSDTDIELEDPEHKFACALCSSRFRTVEELYTHNREHKKKSVFNCHICGKNFGLKFLLNRHLAKHSKAPF